MPLSRLAGWVSAVTLLAATSALAQTLPAQTNSQARVSDDVEGDRVQAGVSFALGWPVGAFRNFADPMAGFGFEATLRVGQSPLRVGGSGYLHFFSGEAAHRLVPGPNGLVRPVIDRSMALLHALVRVQPTMGRVRPYADGLIGVTGFQDRDSIKPGLRDVSFSLGGGGGVMVAVADVGASRIHVDLGVRYVLGGTPEAVDEVVVGVGVPVRDEDMRLSRTDLVTLKAGVVFGF